jgi:hypothetical protein
MPRTIDTPEKQTLVRSTLAKGGVFKAQDAAELIEDERVRRRIRSELLTARNALEAADRVLRDAIHFSRKA